MQHSVDPKNLLTALHYQASGELMRLMDGFYSNIEDGLFELAYAAEHEAKQRKTIELMRELRFRREHLLKTFGKRMQQTVNGWIHEDTSIPEYLEERILADQLAAKCSNHFGPILQSIAERVAHAFTRDIDRRSVPICPEEVSYHFIMTCRSLEFDCESITLIQDLFHRFVLDRLGGIYGPINQQLMEAGYLTVPEMQKLSASTA